MKNATIGRLVAAAQEGDDAKYGEALADLSPKTRKAFEAVAGTGKDTGLDDLWAILNCQGPAPRETDALLDGLAKIAAE